MEAGTLNCPECGAAVAVDAPQCQYCHALLQTVACPKCMGMMFLGSKFCPHCGAAAQAVVVDGESVRSCPRCHVGLQAMQVAKTPLEECPKCGGVWVDVSSFDHICSDAEAQTAATGLNLPPPVPIDPHVKYIECPQCHKLMNRMNYAGRSGIIIGICRSHGIWLDRDELRQIVEFIRAGGMDRMRQIQKEEMDRTLSELEAEHRVSRGTGYLGGNMSGTEQGYAPLLGGLLSVIGHIR